MDHAPRSGFKKVLPGSGDQGGGGCPLLRPPHISEQGPIEVSALQVVEHERPECPIALERESFGLHCALQVLHSLQATYTSDGGRNPPMCATSATALRVENLLV